MTDWNLIINKAGRDNTRLFATGKLSATNFYNVVKNGEAGGEVRGLLRNRKHLYARRLARKALRRRGVNV